MCAKCDEEDAKYNTYTFIGDTSEGHFAIVGNVEYDDFQAIMHGYTVGDRIATVSVVPMPEVIEAREDFLDFMRENLDKCPSASFSARSEEEFHRLLGTVEEAVRETPSSFTTEMTNEEYISIVFDPLDMDALKGILGL